VVNLRFHIASLVAVFFALAIGIGVGSSVVRSGVLERTESQLKSLDARLGQRNKALADLRDERTLDNTLDRVLDRRVLDVALADVPVVVVSTPGVTEKDLTVVVKLLQGSKADVAGTVRVLASARLGPEVDSQFAAIAIGSYSTDPKKVAGTLRERLVDVLAAGETSSTSLDALRSAKVVDARDAAGKRGTIVVTEATRVVMVSVGDAKVNGAQAFLLPFLRAIGREKPGGVVVVDALSAAAEGKSTDRANKVVSAVGSVRRNAATASRVSTIDGVFGTNDVVGRARRVALVLSLLDADRKKVGHYGTGVGAASLVPTG
jgi:hypothetical protein